MLIGVLSDTHDHREHTKSAAEAFKQRNVERVFHLGDYCSPGPIKLLSGLPFLGILGNNDGDPLHLLEMVLQIGGELKGEFAALTIDGLSFALYHGTVPEITDALIACQTYDVVLSGHTHVWEEERRGKTLFLNPGTVHGTGKEATCAVFDTKERRVEKIVLG